jgi:hypothetical protein
MWTKQDLVPTMYICTERPRKEKPKNSWKKFTEA